MHRLLVLLFAASCLATAPRLAAAQDGGFPVQTTARTQFVFKNGEVMRREGSQLTPLTQNVKLANGTKINYKNGIVEMPADKIFPQGKKLTLREDDYVRADGGVVFATPASAAAAQGKPAPAAGAKYETYVQHGLSSSGPAMQVSLLNKKVELLNQKISLLSQGRTDQPDTKAIDAQLTQVDTQLAAQK
ncbi:DUF6799 domain-containing protein [Hymenobacter terricola]|uniref:DUF6799 domain-containing protein n=1 Tax=Hymenobacter terricola TaxID=2819236 RepID=UPI001B30BDBA|nr:DUF6799 domain-containing protein [Hymenobacter terricola]